MPNPRDKGGLAGMRAFKEGYRPPTAAEKRYDEADALLKELSPLYRLTEPNIHVVTNSKLLSSVPAAIGRMFGVKGLRNFEGKPFDPSFAVPMGGLGGMININEDNYRNTKGYLNYPELLAHEAGHIRQGLLGLPVQNDESSDAILADARETKMRRDMNSYMGALPWPAGYFQQLYNAKHGR